MIKITAKIKTESRTMVPHGVFFDTEKAFASLGRVNTMQLPSLDYNAFFKKSKPFFHKIAEIYKYRIVFYKSALFLLTKQKERGKIHLNYVFGEPKMKNSVLFVFTNFFFYFFAFMFRMGKSNLCCE